MSKSEPKLDLNVNDVCLPFANPMITRKGSQVWPFSEKGFALLSGVIHLEEKCVAISDQMAIISLENMGYFGCAFNQFKCDYNSDESLQRMDPKNQVFTKSANIETLDEKQNTNSANKNSNNGINYKHWNGKYGLVSTSVPNALIEDILSPNKSSDNLEITSMSSKKWTKVNKTDKQFDGKDMKRRAKVLKLRFEESFFISYVFGSLNVLNTETKSYMNIEEMWKCFSLHYSEDKLKFAVYYSAYHYFRSKGWIVRNGYSFGTDFLLYKEGPPFYHALYSVTVLQSIDGRTTPQFDWYYMSALIRLSKNVRKELLICIVNVPKNFDISFLDSPNCIQLFNIELLHFERWNTTKGLIDERIQS